MKRAGAGRRLLVRVLLAGAALAFVVPGTGCGGAKHAKIAGPPPEYEPPEPFDAAPPPAVEARPDATASPRPGAAPR